EADDALADIVLGREAEHRELGLVGAYDGAVARDDVHRYSRVLEEVLDLLVRAVHRSRIVEAVDGAGQRAAVVLDRLDMHGRPDRRAVRPHHAAVGPRVPRRARYTRGCGPAGRRRRPRAAALR